MTLPPKTERPCSIEPNGTILLVEDNLINQRVARYVLKMLGCEVHIAANGVEALEMFSDRSYDLILMHCHMPIMDG